MGLRRIAGTALCVCALAAGAFLVVLERFSLPAPTGSYAVGTRLLNLTDEARHEEESADPAARRQLVVQLWYPAEPGAAGPVAHYARWQETRLATRYKALLRTHSRWNAEVADGRFPVLIYSPRWNGERVQNTDLAEELASHGYVVAAIDHPYNAERVLLGDGRVIEADQALEGPKGTAATASDRIAHWNRTLDIWAADDVFVLNRLAAENVAPATSFHGKLDTDHAGAFGHSFGGASSLRLCGLDPRIKAAVNMDGWTFGGLQSRTSAQQVLLMYEQVPEAPAGTVEGDLDRADDDALTRSLTRYGGYRMRIQGTQHMDFSDQPLLPPLRRTGSTGPIPAEEIERILRAYVVRFFDRTLKGKPAGVLAAPKPPFAEVTLETWPAKP